jgi:hypothetical protein
LQYQNGLESIVKKAIQEQLPLCSPLMWAVTDALREYLAAHNTKVRREKGNRRGSKGHKQGETRKGKELEERRK